MPNCGTFWYIFLLKSGFFCWFSLFSLHYAKNWLLSFNTLSIVIEMIDLSKKVNFNFLLQVSSGTDWRVVQNAEYAKNSKSWRGKATTIRVSPKLQATISETEEKILGFYWCRASLLGWNCAQSESEEQPKDFLPAVRSFSDLDNINWFVITKRRKRA